ncbi:MAG: hypothetical protein ACLFR7_06290 [Opitutales bacterium]
MNARHLPTLSNYMPFRSPWLASLRCGLFILCLSPLRATPVEAPSDGEVLEERRYRETTGETTLVRDWRLRREDELLVTSSEINGAEFVNKVQPDGDTVYWRAEREGLQVSAVRDGDQLRISGEAEGKAVDRTLQLPDAPWFQPINFSLEAFVRSEREAQDFVMLNSRDFEFLRLKAIRKGRDTVTVDGATREAVRVELRLRGWRSAFWSADYWFHPEDATFLRYEGVNGPPGTPKTVIEILSVSASEEGQAEDSVHARGEGPPAEPLG